jgi:hypothetical protein
MNSHSPRLAVGVLLVMGCFQASWWLFAFRKGIMPTKTGVGGGYGWLDSRGWIYRAKEPARFFCYAVYFALFPLMFLITAVCTWLKWLN